MIRPIEFLDYDKLSDDVLYLGSKCYLRMNVSLSTKKEPDQRYHYHKEFCYDSPYGGDKKKLVSIKRSFNYYLSIEMTEASHRMAVMILPQDMILFRSKLTEVRKWFDDGTFGIKNNDIIIVRTTQSIILDGLTEQKYLKFDPVVMVFDNGEQTPGMRLSLGSGKGNAFVDITVDKFYALLYIINELNMYQSAIELINYLGRPNYGTNLYEMESTQIPPVSNESKLTGARDQRKIKSQDNKSFFDLLAKD